MFDVRGAVQAPWRTNTADVAVSEMAVNPEGRVVGRPTAGSVAARAPFGRYLIRERIARGGMGEVFHAIAVGADGFEKPVVIKRLLPKFAGRTDLARLFASEARLMTRLVHPNIVQVIDFGRGENDDYYLVMELVAGVDLGRLALSHARREARIPVPVVLYVVSQVLRGLSYAHSTFSADGQKLVHRDISPGNVLLSTFGEVKVADFGVALVTGQADGVEPRLVAGKPGYIAPEQFRGGAVDERADLYSLGALFFEAVTGTLPEMDSSPDPHRPSQLSEKSLQTLLSMASRGVADIVLRALATRPEARFPGARAMLQAIAKLVAKGEPVGDADDLADLVAQAVAEVPSKRVPVVVLGANGPVGGEIVGTELTRREGGEAGHFTVRLTAPGVAGTSPCSAPDEPYQAGTSQRPAPDEPYQAVRTEPIDVRPPSAGAVDGMSSSPDATSSAALAQQQRGGEPYDARAESPDPYPPPATMEGAPPESSRVTPSQRRIRLAGVMAAAFAAGAIAASLQALRGRTDGPLSRIDLGSSTLSLASFAPLEHRATASAEAPSRQAPPSKASPTEPLAAERPTREPLVAASPSPQDAPPAVTSLASARARAATRLKRQDVGAAPSAPGATERATNAHPDDTACRGQLHVYASHGWILHGGPDHVQAPGRYDWPCGVYSLAATSRLDGQEIRRLRITVQNGMTSVLDLR